MKNGIVDVENLNDVQKKEYKERMEAMDFAKNVRGVEGLYKNTSRYHGRVDVALTNLRRARETYEQHVRGAETGLPLSHPKIAAMYLYSFATNESPDVKKVKFEDVEKLAQELPGKSFDQLRIIAGQHMDVVRVREQQQMENQQRMPGMINGA